MAARLLRAHSLFVSGAVSTTVSNAIRIIGLAVFVGGVVVGLREVSRRLRELTAVHKTSQETLARIPAQLDQVEELISQLRAVQRMASGIFAISEANRLSRDLSRAVHVRAAGEVLNYLASEYVPHLAEGFHRFTTNKNQAIELSDHSPIYDLMYQLGSKLPPGGVWFGITLLTSEHAWTNPVDQRFADFTRVMRRRAELKEICVLRLYHFRSQVAFDALRSEMAKEVKNKILVRYVISGDPLPDISLLWTPKTEATHFVLPPGATDPISATQGQYLDPLCALEYETRVGAMLTKLLLYAGGTEDFNKLERRFADLWSDATEFTVDVADATA